MLGLIIGLVIAAGVGGTAVIADNARPGNALFGLDQAMENARLSITAEEKKDELRIKFTEERIKELKDIEDDSDDESDDDSDSDTDGTDDTNDESDGADDKNTKDLSDEDRERVSLGVASAITLLSQVDPSVIDATRLAALIAELNGYLTTLPEETRIQLNDQRFKFKIETPDDDSDDDSDDESDDDQKGNNRVIKIEERTDDGRIRIEVRDGSVQIKTKLDSKDDDDDGDDSDDEHEGLGDVEAKIYSDKTVVEIEYNDQKTTFVTPATTTDTIIAAILEKFPTLTKSQIEAVIEIENEDGDDSDDQDDDSDDDSEDDSNDDSDDDSNDDDSDDDNDDDNSGSGRD